MDPVDEGGRDYNSQSFRARVTDSVLDYNNVTARTQRLRVDDSERLRFLRIICLSFSFIGFTVLPILRTKELNGLNEIAGVVTAHGCNGMKSKKG